MHKFDFGIPLQHASERQTVRLSHHLLQAMPPFLPELEARLLELHEATTSSIQRGLVLPALILIYSGMDAMAWLARPLAKATVERVDFLAWVERYMRPQQNLACSATDLYAARCAVLHSMSSESALSRSGKASMLWYAWGNRSVAPLQHAIAQSPLVDAKAIHLNDLYRTYSQATLDFLTAASTDPALGNLLDSRAQKWFSNLTAPHDESTEG